jgi:transposase
MKMANLKAYNYDQQIIIPVNLHKQLLPGTFEYRLNQLIDKELDLSIFRQKYKNDSKGASAYDPALLLKIVLFAYSRGIISSRKMEALCRENLVCIALTADSHPHFTTIAHFISSMDEACLDLFTQVLAICYLENLIGKELFAIDGCKLSANCSKEWSGTKADFMKKVEKIKQSIAYLINKHKTQDQNPVDEEQLAKEKKAIAKQEAIVKKVTEWLATHDDKIGAAGKPIKSNITDNESAKMATSHGVIQGYNGIAAVDAQQQVIVWADAYGDSNEAGHLPEIVDGIQESCKNAGIAEAIFEEAKLVADSGYHSENSVEAISNRNIDAYIADKQYRTRDVQFQDAGKHKKNIADWQPPVGKKYFTPNDFHFDELTGQLLCPAGHPMWLKCSNYSANGGKHTGKTYMGFELNCLNCTLRAQCLRKATTKARQVLIMDKNASELNHTAQMRIKFDTPEGRSIYAQRMGIIEPVFGHLRGAKKLDHFTLRGRAKVRIQWLLYCIVHNITKLQVYGSSGQVRSALAS